jgi:hypothetical protein
MRVFKDRPEECRHAHSLHAATGTCVCAGTKSCCSRRNLQSHSEALADLQPQMRIVLSALQVASSSPDGDQETHHTPSV